MVIVQQLVRILPERYVAAPRVHLGSEFEVDICAYEQVDGDRRGDEIGAFATSSAWAATQPTLTLETELADTDEYEVPPATYAAACRWRPVGTRMTLEAWSQPLVVGNPLPVLPLWLSEELAVPLDLEASYEQTCRDLRIA